MNGSRKNRNKFIEGIKIACFVRQWRTAHTLASYWISIKRKSARRLLWPQTVKFIKFMDAKEHQDNPVIKNVYMLFGNPLSLFRWLYRMKYHFSSNPMKLWWIFRYVSGLAQHHKTENINNIKIYWSICINQVLNDQLKHLLYNVIYTAFCRFGFIVSLVSSSSLIWTFSSYFFRWIIKN